MGKLCEERTLIKVDLSEPYSFYQKRRKQREPSRVGPPLHSQDISIGCIKHAGKKKKEPRLVKPKDGVLNVCFENVIPIVSFRPTNHIVSFLLRIVIMMFLFSAVAKLY